MKLKYKIPLLLIVALAGLIAAGSQFEPVKAAARKVVYNLRFNDGLVGYWSFNGADMSGITATDRGSGGNNGTLTNGPTAVPGVVGQGLNFDGSNDFVELGDGFTGKVSYALDYSISVWAKPAGVANYNTVINISPGADPGDRNGIIWNGSTNEFAGLYWNGTAYVGKSGGASRDQWHHLVLINQASAVTFYIDGVAQAGGVVDGLNTNNWIGRNDSGAFAGPIDEVRVYDRALSAAEIAYQYAKTKPASSGGSGTLAKAIPNMNNLAAHWDFDDCDTCSSVADRSGNGNTATMYTSADSAAGDMHTTLGKIGNGATFSGTANIAAPNIRLDDRSFSIGFWFNSGNLASDRALFGQSSTGGCTVKNCLHLAIRSSKLMFGFYFSDLAGNATLTTNKWYHAVFVYDKVAALKYIYLDGVLDNSGSSEVYLGTSGNTKIGSDCCDSGFIGSVDDLKIYTRAIGVEEAKQLYNNSVRKTLMNMPQTKLLSDGLVGFWSFNGQDMSGVTAIDRGSGGNNGTLTGGPTAIPGIVGQALNFDGVDDYVDATAPTVLQSSSTFTVSFWANALQYRENDGGVAIRNGTSAGSLFIIYPYDTYSGNGVRVHFNGFSIIDQNNGNIADGQWHHFLFVARSDVDQEIFVDGASAGTSVTSKTLPATLSNVTMGAWRPSNQLHLGPIDEVRIYNRALTAGEIIQLYNAGKR